jgi:hypothetical protein
MVGEFKMIRDFALRALPLAMAAATATPALAAAPTTCSGYATTIINGWTSCAGFYDMNVFSNSAAHVGKQVEAVTFLGGCFDGDFDALFGFGSLGDGSNGARTIEFGKKFYGQTIVGAHFGNVGAPNDAFGNVSVFYKFDFGMAGADSIDFVQSRGLSNLYVYGSDLVPGGLGSVPEPGAWALMILGLGMVGAALRSSRKQRVSLRYA